MADNTKQKKKDFTDIRVLAQDVVALEAKHGKKIKLNSALYKKMALEYNKVINLNVKAGSAGKKYLDTVNLTALASESAANAAREQTEHTIENSATIGKAVDAHAEVAKLADEVAFSMKEQVPYADDLLSMETELIEVRKNLVSDQYEQLNLAKQIDDAVEQGNIDLAIALMRRDNELKISIDEAKIRKGTLKLSHKELGLASSKKEELLRQQEIQEGMNELFGISVKDLEKYGKKFKAFVTNPAMIGMGVIAGIGAVLKKFLISPIQDSMKLQSELGIGAGHAWDLTLASKEAAAGGFMYGESVEESLQRAKSLVETWGVLNDETLRSIKVATDLERTYGVSTDSAAGLAQMMEATSDSSKDILMKEMAGDMLSMQEAGLPVGSIMNDIAGNTDFFAGHMKDGGKNIFKAAKWAKKLGMSMSTISGAAESLLDWETSINAEMEASVLLGRSVNMEEARRLMFEGKHEEAMKAIMVQVGSEADFADMNLVQREALAAAAGLSLTDLTKMVAAEQKLASMSVTERKAHEKRNKLTGRLQKIFGGIVDMFREWYGRLMIPIYETFQKMFGAGLNLSGEVDNTKGILEKIKESVEHIIVGVIKWVEALNLPKIKAYAKTVWDVVLGVKAVLGWMLEHKKIMITIAALWALNKIGMVGIVTGPLKAMSMGLAGIIKQLASKGFAKLQGAFGGDGPKKKGPKPKPKPKGRKGGKGGMGFMEKVDGKKMIQGAAALLIAAAALWVIAKALQEFNTVDWPSLAKAALALLGITVVLTVLGKMTGNLIAGAAAMVIMGAALWVFAKSLQEFNTVDWSSLPKAALALVVLTAAMFGLGALISTGLGAALFVFGVLGFIALGGALIVLGAGLMSIGKGVKIVSELTAPLTSLVSIVGKIGLLALGFIALGASLGVLAIGAMLLYPALPALRTLSSLGIMPAGATVNNKTESNAKQRTTQVEKEIKKTNDRLDTLISTIEKQANLEALKKISRSEISAIQGAFGNR